jgi:hypothetical protein
MKIDKLSESVLGDVLARLFPNQTVERQKQLVVCGKKISY